jgi:hypothetical protein
MTLCLGVVGGHLWFAGDESGYRPALGVSALLSVALDLSAEFSRPFHFGSEVFEDATNVFTSFFETLGRRAGIEGRRDGHIRVSDSLQRFATL